jgi:hypothetical protein
MLIPISYFSAEVFPDSQERAAITVSKLRIENSVADTSAPWTIEDHLAALYSRISHMRVVDRHLGELPVDALKVFKCLWTGEPMPDDLSGLTEHLEDAGKHFAEWRHSAARAGADTALRFACSWYEGQDLDALHNMRSDAPTNIDPAKAAGTGLTTLPAMPPPAPSSLLQLTSKRHSLMMTRRNKKPATRMLRKMPLHMPQKSKLLKPLVPQNKPLKHPLLVNQPRRAHLHFMIEV